MTLKYIRTRGDQIIVFPDTMSHDEFKSFDPVSAGFIDFNADEKWLVSVYCHGSSHSLKMHCQPGDTDLANKYYADKQ